MDDLRESPAVEVVHLLQAGGAHVRAYEPFKPGADVSGIALAPSLEAAVEDAEALVLLVRHTQFVGLNPMALSELTSARLAVDTVNGWEPAVWERAGFEISRLGVGK